MNRYYEYICKLGGMSETPLGFAVLKRSFILDKCDCVVNKQTNKQKNPKKQTNKQNKQTNKQTERKSAAHSPTTYSETDRQTDDNLLLYNP